MDTEGEVFNEYEEDGKVTRVAVGNMRDLNTIQVKEIGGVPIEELQRSVKGLRGGRCAVSHARIGGSSARVNHGDERTAAR